MGKTKPKTILPHRKIIGAAIRRYRKTAGFTQEPLAEKVDLTTKHIGEVERGEKIISIEALMRISRTVKVPVGEFFKEI